MLDKYIRWLLLLMTVEGKCHKAICLHLKIHHILKDPGYPSSSSISRHSHVVSVGEDDIPAPQSKMLLLIHVIQGIK